MAETASDLIGAFGMGKFLIQRVRAAKRRNRRENQTLQPDAASHHVFRPGIFYRIASRNKTSTFSRATNVRVRGCFRVIDKYE